MDQTNELFNTLSEEEIAAYTADPGTEPHIVIDKDRFAHVPEELRRIAVEGDHNIETVTFDCPRYWDEHDLSKMIIYIRYACPNSELGGYVAQNVRVDSSAADIIHFEWTISENVTVKAGNLAFMVVAKKSDEETGESLNRWNSEPNTEMYVSKGIPGDTVDYTAGNDDLLTQVLLLKDTFSIRVDTAEVGQTIVVKSVDENGKPTEWEATPLGLRKIIDYTTEEETANGTVGYVEFFTDIDGNPISMKNCLLKFCGALVNETDNDYHLRMDFLSKYTGTWYEFKPTAKNTDFAFCLMVSIDEQGRLSFIEGSNKRLSDVSSHGITAIEKISIYTNNLTKTHIAAGAHIQVWEVM